jgi:hypothetical protein
MDQQLERLRELRQQLVQLQPNNAQKKEEILREAQDHLEQQKRLCNIHLQFLIQVTNFIKELVPGNEKHHSH